MSLGDVGVNAALRRSSVATLCGHVNINFQVNFQAKNFNCLCRYATMFTAQCLARLTFFASPKKGVQS